MCSSTSLWLFLLNSAFQYALCTRSHETLRSRSIRNLSRSRSSALPPVPLLPRLRYDLLHLEPSEWRTVHRHQLCAHRHQRARRQRKHTALAIQSHARARQRQMQPACTVLTRPKTKRHAKTW